MGDGMSRARMSYVSRAHTGPFSNIRPQIYFKDFGGKEPLKVDTQRLMEHRAVGQELVSGSILDPSVVFRLYPAATCSCVPVCACVCK